MEEVWLAGRGALEGAVLFYSTEVPELVHLADRVMVFYSGAIATE